MANEVIQTSDKTPAETPETTTGGRIYRPLADIVESDEGVMLMLGMPGGDRGDAGRPRRDAGAGAGVRIIAVMLARYARSTEWRRSMLRQFQRRAARGPAFLNARASGLA